MDSNKTTSAFEFKGLHGKDYHYKRLNTSTVKFSLQCRIQAISQGVREIFPSRVDTLLDVGSADGLLAEGISEMLHGIKHIYALDMDRELLQYNQFPSFQADSARIPFSDKTFDVVTAAALIEHLSDPNNFLYECHRVLKPQGALLLTCPDPFFDWIATKTGYLRDSGHVARYSLKDLRRLCGDAGFSVRLLRKFMVTPIGFSGHKQAESMLRKVGLSCLMLNQIVGSIKLPD